MVRDKTLDRPVSTLLAAEVIAVVWTWLVFVSRLDIVLETIDVYGVVKLEIGAGSEIRVLVGRRGVKLEADDV